MAILARAIINADPARHAIYAQKYFLWNGIKQPSRNLLLWRDGGLKTGHTDEAGNCLVASAKRGNQRLIAARFGTDSEAARATETVKLLGYGFRFFESKTFYKKGTVLTAPVWKGAAREIKAGVNQDVAVSVADKLVAQIVLKPTLIAPVKQGDVVGKVEVRQGDKVVKQADVVALEKTSNRAVSSAACGTASACSSRDCSAESVNGFDNPRFISFT